MARVLMVSYGPMPDPDRERNSSACLRTRQFLSGALEGGHEVELVTLPLPGSSEDDPDSDPSFEPGVGDGHAYYRFTRHSGEFAIGVLNDRIAENPPDALVAVNTYPAYVAAMLASTLPLWADLNGLWMAQMQARCFAEQDDSRLVGGWAIERAVLRRLDKFSAVSRPQLHAVLGEMATLGRFNKFTYQYPFGSHVPIAVEESEIEEAEAAGGEPPILRGQRLPENAFIVLWSGGFNLWTDIETLVAATDTLMSRYPEVHFVATGAEVEGVDTTTYERFQEALAESSHRDRYHLLGWIKGSDLRRLYREADVGLNVDGANYETLFGARTRLLSMVSAGLTVATSLGTELSEWLEDGHAALIWQMGDADSLVEAIEPWIEQREQLKKYSERALAIVREDFTIPRSTRALRKWLEDPQLAPDNQAKLEDSPAGDLTDLNAATLNTLEAQAVLLDQYDARSLLKSQREMEVLQKRTWFQAYKKAKRWIAD